MKTNSESARDLRPQAGEGRDASLEGLTGRTSPRGGWTAMRRTMTSVLGAALLALSVLVPVAPASAAGQTFTVGPTDRAGLTVAIEKLRAGDTLRLLPGTYRVGGFKPLLAKGRKDAPIRVVPADTRQLPVIEGQVIFQDADYWQFVGLRIKATVKSQPALKMAGGDGWTVSDGEMWGAADTVVHGNVVIDSDRSTSIPPTNWRFTQNCVHHGALQPKGDGAGYHNIYVNAEGGGANGLIARNIIFNAPGGSNIKVGAGGNPRTRGVSGVKIEYNTMYDAHQQLLLFGDISGISVRRNLLIRSRGTNVQTGQYINTIKDDGRLRVTSTDNYGYLMKRATFVLDTKAHTFKESGNVLGADPKLGVGCGQFRPTTAAAKAYGRWAPS